MKLNMHTPGAAALCSAIVAACLSGGAAGQTVYKCTQDGKVSYGDAPCPGSAAAGTTTAATLAVPLAPAPDPNTAATLKRQHSQADALEKARHQREAKDTRDMDRAAQAAEARQKKCAKLKLNKRWADDDVKSAGIARLEQAQLKAKRAADTLALECPR